MANFRPKPWTNPFGKISISGFFKLLVFIAYIVVFFVLEYRKTRLLPYIAKRKKGGKIANFGPQQWSNPFGKISIFRLFKLFVFIA